MTSNSNFVGLRVGYNQIWQWVSKSLISNNKLYLIFNIIEKFIYFFFIFYKFNIFKFYEIKYFFNDILIYKNMFCRVRRIFLFKRVATGMFNIAVPIFKKIFPGSLRFFVFNNWVLIVWYVCYFYYPKLIKGDAKLKYIKKLYLKNYIFNKVGLNVKILFKNYLCI